MNSRKQYESGFSAVILVLIIIIVGLGGTVGWLAYQSYHRPKATNSTTDKQVTPAKNSAPVTQSVESQPQVLDCLNHTSAKLVQIVLACADVNTVAENIVWSSWAPDTAVGSGDIKANDCKPDCADGHFHTYPAKFSLSGVKKVGQINYFTALQVQYTGSYPGQGATENYSLSTP
jgi:hypothetical protein